VNSGQHWEDDPAGNLVAHGGRTLRRDMRSKTDPTKIAVVKRAKGANPVEVYSIGMERVGYRLAVEQLGLPVPETHLEVVDGHPSSVQRRIEPARSWLQLGAAPAMRDNIVNRDLWPRAALFDVWIGNTDRRMVNFLFEPVPPGTPPGRARGSSMWLIDHGQCGLWPADKFEGRQPDDIPTDAATISGELRQAGEAAIGQRMPPEYRMALKQCTGQARDQLLDLVRAVRDDAIDAALSEIPSEFMAPAQSTATAAFLKARRDAIDRVIATYW
jgi:hypothetical protein